MAGPPGAEHIHKFIQTYIEREHLGASAVSFGQGPLFTPVWPGTGRRPGLVEKGYTCMIPVGPGRDAASKEATHLDTVPYVS